MSLNPYTETHRHADVPPDLQRRGVKPIRNAAVLIPLVRQRDAWHVLYIRRTQRHSDHHSGQVAFPGGAEDITDLSPIDNALREAEEEVGIRPAAVKIVACLSPYLTVSDFRVTPVVGLVKWPCTMKLQTSEVARAFTIPLAWLRDPGNHQLRTRQRRAGNTSSLAPGAQERRYPVVYFNEYDGELLWGATARMTLNFIDAIDQGELLLPG